MSLANHHLYLVWMAFKSIILSTREDNIIDLNWAERQATKYVPRKYIFSFFQELYSVRSDTPTAYLFITVQLATSQPCECADDSSPSACGNWLELNASGHTKVHVPTHLSANHLRESSVDVVVDCVESSGRTKCVLFFCQSAFPPPHSTRLHHAHLLTSTFDTLRIVRQATGRQPHGSRLWCAFLDAHGRRVGTSAVRNYARRARVAQVWWNPPNTERLFHQHAPVVRPLQLQ